MFVSCAVHSQCVRWLLVRDAAWPILPLLSGCSAGLKVSHLADIWQDACQARHKLQDRLADTWLETLRSLQDRLWLSAVTDAQWRHSFGMYEGRLFHMLLLLMRLIWHAVTFPLLERHPAVNHGPDFHTVTTAAVDTLSGFIYQGDDRAGRTFGEFCQSRGPPAG